MQTRIPAFILLFYFLTIACSCRDSIEKQLSHTFHSSQKPIIIVLQPLDSFPEAMIKVLKDSISNYYPAQVYVHPTIAIPKTFFYIPRNRYRADSIIHWLQHMKKDSVRSLVGLTLLDISTTKGAVKDYGIMGLGYQPGPSCVVSMFRLGKDNAAKKITQRLLKTVVHELGHNLGLPHCTNQHCIMADAEGKLKQDNEYGICNECRKKLDF